MNTGESIGGHQRVAAFLLSLEPDVASSILKTMRPQDVDRISQAMMDLDPRLSGDGKIEDLFREVALELHRTPRLKPCDTAELSEMLGKAFGRPKADELVQAILERRIRARPFLNIESHAPRLVAQVLEDESNAVCSLVLSFISPALAAEVLKLLDSERVLEIVPRMATLEPPGAQILRAIAAGLEARLSAASEEVPEEEAPSRLQAIADLLSYTDPEIEKGALESIASDNEEVAAELRERMFTWDNLASVDRRIMQKILGTVDTKTLSVAIKACPPAVEENLMGNLSSRVREMVAEERELAGAVPMSAVESARNEILASIRAMIESGEFRPSRSGENLVQ